MIKHKYLSNYGYFSLWSNALFGLWDCDYTRVTTTFVLKPQQKYEGM
jgi:hypothetical protein